MAALPHLECRLSAFRVSDADETTLLCSLTGEYTVVQGRWTLEFDDESPWAFLDDIAEAADPVWVSTLLKRTPMHVQDGIEIIADGQATSKLHLAQRQSVAKFPSLLCDELGGNVSLKLHNMQAPTAGCMICWQLREFQDSWGETFFFFKKKNLSLILTSVCPQYQQLPTTQAPP